VIAVAFGGGQGATATANCAQDYTGTLCSKCSEHAYQLQGRCYSCGDSIDQTRTITITVVAMATAMLLLSVAVACMSAPRLALTVQVFQLLQGAATVGVQGAKFSPVATQQLLQIFTSRARHSTETYRRADDGRVAHGGCAWVRAYVLQL